MMKTLFRSMFEDFKSFFITSLNLIEIHREMRENAQGTTTEQKKNYVMQLNSNSFLFHRLTVYPVYRVKVNTAVELNRVLSKK